MSGLEDSIPWAVQVFKEDNSMIRKLEEFEKDSI